MRMILLNGGLWSAGNGLTSGAVVYYLAFEMGANAGDIGWILAAPAVAGLLRMFSPQLIRSFGSARRTCLIAWLLSYLIAWGLPLLAAPLFRPASALTGVTTLIVVLAAHQLFEYVGVVGFWAWMAEVIPRRIRGRYFARRNRWQLAALIPTLLLSGWFIDAWKQHFASWSDAGVGWAYAIATSCGAAFLLASLIPLFRIRPLRSMTTPSENEYDKANDKTHVEKSASTRTSLWAAPFADFRFRRLLAYGCFVAFANGLTQSAQSYAHRTYGIALALLAAMRISMLAGQFTASGWLGRFSDRNGNKPGLVLCQLIVAFGPMFYLLASPEEPWWICGAWLAWSAFAGLNICLPNLMLKLGPGQTKSAYIATYFAVSGLIYAISTIAGGYLLVGLQQWDSIKLFSSTVSAERVLFLFGWILRSLSVLLLLWLVEPGAIGWMRLLFRKPARTPRR